MEDRLTAQIAKGAYLEQAAQVDMTEAIIADLTSAGIATPTLSARLTLLKYRAKLAADWSDSLSKPATHFIEFDPDSL